MKKFMLRLVSIGVLIAVMAGCNNDGNNTDVSQSTVDNKQLPISAIQTDSSSDESGPDTQNIRFLEGNDNNPDTPGDRRQDYLNGNPDNRGPIGGNARDPGRDQDQEVRERNRQNQDRSMPQRNRPNPQQNGTEQQPGNQSDLSPTNQQGISEYASKVIDLTNKERSQQGLSTLKISQPLSDVARSKSKDMQGKNYFSHTSPTYGSPFNMMRKFNISFETAGENIAKGQQSPQQVVDSWMNSKKHRENIMNEQFTHIGVGYRRQGNYWTQMFIEK